MEVFQYSGGIASVLLGIASVLWRLFSTVGDNISTYYALNKILNSDWLNANLTLVDVWLGGSNVRQRNLMSGK